MDLSLVGITAALWLQWGQPNPGWQLSHPIPTVHELWFWWLRGFRGKQVLTAVVSPKQLVL